ncbi:hypothetical protein EI94DRAFT_1794382 [Lactarius quietus]|nr:hypothetical protein EI94DRAFT_1794382 [Lactarius quietus]
MRPKARPVYKGKGTTHGTTVYGTAQIAKMSTEEIKAYEDAEEERRRAAEDEYEDLYVNVAEIQHAANAGREPVIGGWGDDVGPPLEPTSHFAPPSHIEGNTMVTCTNSTTNQTTANTVALASTVLNWGENASILMPSGAAVIPQTAPHA